MGYTHFWESPQVLDRNKFKEFLNSMEYLFEYAKENDILIDSIIMKDADLNKANFVKFNGTAPYDYEDCYICDFGRPYDMERLYRFDFCKTARMPYDKIVIGAISLLHKFFPDIEISSDGGDEALLEGEELANMILSKNNLLGVQNENQN